MDRLRAFAKAVLYYARGIDLQRISCSLPSNQVIRNRNTVNLAEYLTISSLRTASESTGPFSLRPLIIFILGAPGVGKGTISSFLKETFPTLTHLSYGELVNYCDKSPGSWVSCLPRRGGSLRPLVPARDAVRLVGDAMKEGIRRHGRMIWLIDGLPRDQDHVVEWMTQIGRADFILYLSCPPEVSYARMDKRAETSGRPEDADPAKVRERVQRNIRANGPMLEALEKSGIELVRVDANRDLPVVKREVLDHVQNVIQTWISGQIERARSS
ncbi:hypothetical protein M426DRAFT_12088 [Hypoxylon sp. CI-4A]|nr:hypothetical protein M426DRAFT_12088 [Hypoxylon sp. CI-4A]